MFGAIKTKVRDIGTIAKLSSEAERISRSHGSATPGSEHFVLAALTLPDQTAARAFDRLNLTSEAFSNAIRQQFIDALAHAGVAVESTPAATHHAVPTASAATKLYLAAPSGQALMQRVAASRTARRSRPLLGADVLLAASDEELSASARAFKQLGIGRKELENSAKHAIDGWKSVSGEA